MPIPTKTADRVEVSERHLSVKRDAFWIGLNFPRRWRSIRAGNRAIRSKGGVVELSG